MPYSARHAVESGPKFVPVNTMLDVVDPEVGSGPTEATAVMVGGWKSIVASSSEVAVPLEVPLMTTLAWRFVP
jgi:hypothetical protein